MVFYGWTIIYMVREKNIKSAPKDVIDHFLEENEGKYKIIYKKLSNSYKKISLTIILLTNN